MKLIKCYIENFGGLKQYEMKFNTGITVIEEPNGFGKTTLAEFIKAMFYGFPRAGRALDKNIRKKYLPWQGGRYGGNLVFEHNGKKYRIDRTFGNVPRLDTFLLTDDITHRKSTDFTENIGVELFELDADSFERSTYLPQLLDGSSLATTGIQAKLGDLVEDTNDINNYEKAITALKSSRSGYIPYRGNGGSVADASMRIFMLTDELADSDKIYNDLYCAQSENAELKKEKDIKETSLASIRSEITVASEYAANKIVSEQYKDLKQRQQKNLDDLKQLEQEYTYGVPSKEHLDQIEPLYDQIIALDNQAVHSQADDDAQIFIDANSKRFSTGVPTEKEIKEQEENCREYLSTELALQHAKLSDDEQMSLTALEKFLGKEIPDEPFLQDCQRKSKQLQSIRLKKDTQKLTEDEQNKLQSLEQFFSSGVPEEPFLANCKEKADKLQSLQIEKEAQHLSQEELAKLQNLSAFFVQGVPTEEELNEKNTQLQHLNSLREENVRLTANQVQAIQEKTVTEKPTRSPALIVILLAIAVGCFGVYMLWAQSYIYGGICLGAGVLAAMVAVYINLKHVVSSEISSVKTGVISVSEEDRKQIKNNEQQAASLEHDILIFVSRYITDSRSISEKMQDILSKRSDYVQLKAKYDGCVSVVANLDTQISEMKLQLVSWLSPYALNNDQFSLCISNIQNKLPLFTALKEKQSEYQQTNSLLDMQIAELKQEMVSKLSPYALEEEQFDVCISNLRDRISQFTTLKNKESNQRKHAEMLKGKLLSLQTTIAEFLTPFCGIIEPEAFGKTLSDLQKDSNTYRSSQIQLQNTKEKNEARQKALNACEELVQKFDELYHIHLDLRDRTAFQNIADDVMDYGDLQQQVAKDKKNITDFYEKNRKALTAIVPAELPGDLEDLKLAESQLIDVVNELNQKILDKEQQIRQLQSKADQIPVKEDELEKWKAKKIADSDNCMLLDRTIEFLTKAKESLSDNYLGTIKKSFSEYMHRLAGENADNIVVSPDLNVQLERLGQARDIAYFSVGQSDMIMLCMRLALVDALFKDVKPFIILDDPFVNLDDEHTEQALKMLNEFGRDHQIIYMVCNSSRTIPAKAHASK